MTRSVAAGRWRPLLELAVWFVALSFVLLLGMWNFLLPGPQLVLLLLLVAAGAGWLVAVWRHGWRLTAAPIDAGLGLFLAALLLATLLSIDPSRSARQLWQWSAVALVYMMALVAWRRGWHWAPFRAALLLTLALLLASAYFELFSWARGWQRAFAGTGLWPATWPRLSGVTNSPNTLAALLAPGVLLAAGDGDAAGRRARWLWVAAALPILVLSGSRSGLLGLVVGLAVPVVAGYGRLSAVSAGRRRRLAGLGATALAALLAVSAWLRPLTLQTSAPATDSRFFIWRVALEMAREAPLKGWGPFTYSSAYAAAAEQPPGIIFVTAHSLPLGVLAEMGLVGTAALLVLAAQFGRFLWRRRAALQGDGVAITLLAALASLAVHALFDVPESWVLFLAALLIAALTARLDLAPPATRLARWRLVWAIVWLLLVAGGLLGWRATAAYNEGVTAAAAGDWATAARAFAAGQAALPYDDSSLLLATGFVEGALAVADPTHLAPAIDAHERLVALEPGWSLHRANLAGLYWQAGRRAAAIDALAEAVEQSPRAAPYYLTLGQWQEQVGDDAGATTTYRHLLTLDEAWPDAPFWSETALRRAVAATAVAAPGSATAAAPAGWAALAAGEPATAVTAFAAAVAANTSSGEARFGLGVAELFAGRPEAAARSLAQADLLRVRAGSTDRVRQWAALWAALLPGAPAERFQTQLAVATRHSVHGVGLNGGSYTFSAMLRFPFPHDVLPQLSCFAATPGLATQLQLMAAWQRAQNAMAEAVAIERLLTGRGDGVRPCLAVGARQG